MLSCPAPLAPGMTLLIPATICLPFAGNVWPTRHLLVLRANIQLRA